MSGDCCASKNEKIEQLRAALQPFADVVFNDNGDVTYDYSSISRDDYWRAYCALRKIGN